MRRTSYRDRGFGSVAARVPWLIVFASLALASPAGAQEAILSQVCVPPLPSRDTVCTTVIDTTKLKNGPVCLRVTDAAGNATQHCFVVQNPAPAPVPSPPGAVRVTIKP